MKTLYQDVFVRTLIHSLVVFFNLESLFSQKIKPNFVYMVIGVLRLFDNRQTPDHLFAHQNTSYHDKALMFNMSKRRQYVLYLFLIIFIHSSRTQYISKHH